MADGNQSSSITISGLDNPFEERLRARAAEHGRTIEAEARSILQDALAPEDAAPVPHLYHRIRALFAPLGGVELDIPPRELAGDPPSFD